MSNHEPQVERMYDKGYRFFTPGTWVLIGLIMICAGVAFGRFFFGLSAVTNLDNDYPWGIWKGINIATFIVLGAAGFTMAFIAHIYGHHKYSTLSRQGVVFGLLCYTFAPISLLIDLGRYWLFWHPIFPRWWQGNSVLFEVAICVMLYLTVLLIEFMPFVIEKYKGKVAWFWPLSMFNRLTEWFLWIADFILLKINIPIIRMPLLAFFVILGVVLSCLHQSSLGTLMVIAGEKLHPLWQSPMLPLLFLMSAFAVGFPVLIFVSLINSYSFGKKPEMKILSQLANYTPWLLGIYFILKMYDLNYRGANVYLYEPSIQKWAWLLEVGLLVLALLMFMLPKVRKTPNWLFMASTFAMVSMAANRQNVLVTAYRPPGVEHVYVPSTAEFFFTVGLIASIIVFYRFIVIYVPIMKKGGDIKPQPEAEPQPEMAASTAGGAE
ncbi:Ni/Fe-hydrogenase cytochrome b subunit [bacterium]|nr:Ni/Fe-hydrogenase cytochrome b subunit [bacterium]